MAARCSCRVQCFLNRIVKLFCQAQGGEGRWERGEERLTFHRGKNVTLNWLVCHYFLYLFLVENNSLKKLQTPQVLVSLLEPGKKKKIMTWYLVCKENFKELLTLEFMPWRSSSHTEAKLHVRAHSREKIRPSSDLGRSFLNIGIHCLSKMSLCT